MAPLVDVLREARPFVSDATRDAILPAAAPYVVRDPEVALE